MVRCLTRLLGGGISQRWRATAYIDPGLPTALLPDEWPGFDSLCLFRRLSEHYAADSV